jgi:hypothetical protein
MPLTTHLDQEVPRRVGRRHEVHEDEPEQPEEGSRRSTPLSEVNSSRLIDRPTNRRPMSVADAAPAVR